MMVRHPWLLATALPLLVWLFRAVRSGRRPAWPWSDETLLRRLPRTAGVWMCRLRPWLAAGAVTALAVALARPQAGVTATRIRAEALDLVLAVDVSTSMLAEDFTIDGQPRNRLDAVVQVAREFIKRHPGDRIGLVAYAGIPFTLAPPTLDHDWLMRRLDELDPGMVRDGTAIGDGLAAALNRLRDSEAESRIVILLTDGVHNAGTLAPEVAAELARALGIRVHAVGVGTRGVAPVPVRDAFGRIRRIPQPVEIDEELLMRMAERTGGRYARAEDTEALAEIYRWIEDMERTDLPDDRYREYEERFWIWALAGLLLLSAEKLVALSRFGGLP